MKRLLTVSAASLCMFFASSTIALAVTGAVDTTYHYAWSNNGGWVNWKASGGNVVVSNSGISGYIWSANFGWINLSPSQGGVTNTNGTLSGYAWGTNTGWINFSGVTIDANGFFHGRTTAQNIFGTMTFDCANCSVNAQWFPTTSGSTSSGGGGVIGGGPYSFGYQTQNNTSTTSTDTNAQEQETVPPTLRPTSRPPATQPTTNPPTSTDAAAYTSQARPVSIQQPPVNVQAQATSTTKNVLVQISHTIFSTTKSWLHKIATFFVHLFLPTK